MTKHLPITIYKACGIKTYMNSNAIRVAECMTILHLQKAFKNVLNAIMHRKSTCTIYLSDLCTYMKLTTYSMVWTAKGQHFQQIRTELCNKKNLKACFNWCSIYEKVFEECTSPHIHFGHLLIEFVLKPQL